MPDEIFKANCIHVKFGDIPAYTFSMTVRQLIHIYYIAVRGVDTEEGAVQRPLSTRRIENIKNYVLDGNTFFNSFILNWTAGTKKVDVSKTTIKFPLVLNAAQAIDGQHRLAGLERAVEVDPNIENMSLIVTLCIGLATDKAAQIFLNINTEQKPVPRSLIYDLFGLVEDNPEHAINRATDIARKLNDDEESPLYNLIKFPGAPKGMGKIELSTFVTALKGSLEKDGVFAKTKISTLENQTAVIGNYFTAIKSSYVQAGIWSSAAKNPFFKAAGFNGAIDFLVAKLITECASRSSFKVEIFKQILDLEETNLLEWADVKGQDGKTARKSISTYLEQGLLQEIVEDGSYEF